MMRKISQKFTRVTATLVSAAVLIVNIFVPITVSAFAGGDGTEGNPYQVASCADLLSISDMDARYLLTADIDCSSDGNNVIIGSTGTPFTGVFNGNYHEITVDIETTGVDYVGLFSSIVGGTVKNLEVTGSVISDGSYVGMLAGAFETSTADFITISGTVNASVDYVGGVFGRTLCDSVILASTSSVTVTGRNYVGGFIGNDQCPSSGLGASVSYSSASGLVTANDYAGGFAGQALNAEFTTVSATGNVVAHDNAGGLIGYYSRSGNARKILLSRATGNVSGRYSLGGLVGHMPNGEVSQSFATGNVTGASGDDVGGLLGRVVLGSSITVVDSYARGNVSTNGSTGGLVGYGGQNTVHIIRSYATGALSSLSTPGGINGDGVPGEVTNSFWDTQTTGASGSCGGFSTCTGNGKTTAEMKTQSTFTDAGWDFTNTWAIYGSTNNGYPYLLGQSSFVCEETQVTSTTGKMACDLTYFGQPTNPDAVTWQARYKKTSDVSWTDVTIDDSAMGRMIFRDLDPATSYQLSLKPTQSVFTNWATTGAITLAANSDLDGDGILDSVENDGPNGGDTNEDGTLDATEADMATGTNPVSGNYAGLTTNCTAVDTMSVTAEPTDHQDAAYSYAAGLMSFTATGCGSVATFTQYFYGDYDASKLVARKYNSATNAYTTIPGAVLTNVTIGGVNAVKVVYQITDNSSLDQSAVAGTITDPAGPGLLVLGAPNTGFAR